jgi:serine/threonine protein kinase
MAVDGQTKSYVGTSGYIAPEGPGTAAADIYSFGQVLYDMGFGGNGRKYPDLPTDLVNQTGDPGLLRLNQIILKACERLPEDRFRSMEELKAALTDLLRQISGSG